MLALQNVPRINDENQTTACALKVNNMVLVKGDSAPRLSWQKGKVEKLIYGHDNLVRGADVRIYQDKLGETVVIRRL